ncbi:unnamed protein product [Penicillium camemberti]|uniref:Str. FM013 n=1 Tax=Penicillium camemberti (strain FM 013) TaxID=1429867 RepID=A0A0G4PM74_PENC3|nr:unnamed protein product [Penicillium camemberti]
MKATESEQQRFNEQNYSHLSPKNTQTAIWTILSQRNVEFNIIITATPMFNSIDDLACLVGLLGSRGVARLKSKLCSDPHLKRGSSCLDKTHLSKIKENFEDVPTTSPLRLNLPKSSTLRKITKEEVFGVYAAVPVYFALVFDTVAIQRTQASFLKKLKRCHDPIEK